MITVGRQVTFLPPHYQLPRPLHTDSSQRASAPTVIRDYRCGTEPHSNLLAQIRVRTLELHGEHAGCEPANLIFVLRSLISEGRLVTDFRMRVISSATRSAFPSPPHESHGAAILYLRRVIFDLWTLFVDLSNSFGLLKAKSTTKFNKGA